MRRRAFLVLGSASRLGRVWVPAGVYAHRVRPGWPGAARAGRRLCQSDTGSAWPASAPGVAAAVRGRRRCHRAPLRPVRVVLDYGPGNWNTAGHDHHAGAADRPRQLDADRAGPRPHGGDRRVGTRGGCDNNLDTQIFASDLENEAVQKRLADALADQITLQLASFFRKRADWRRADGMPRSGKSLF